MNIKLKRRCTNLCKCCEELRDVKNKHKDLIIKFMNSLLNPNTKSKNFIEIPDFKYHLNNLLGEIKEWH